MTRIALALAALFAVLALLSWMLRAPPARVARFLRRFAFIVAMLVLVYLAATGRLHWLFVILGSLLAFLPRLLPLLGYIPLLGGLYRRYKAARAATAGAGGSGQASQVETRYLRMRLNHDTGAIDGIVIDGRFRGAQLTELSLAQLVALLHECRLNDDEESARLLQAFLDHVHGEAWREYAEQRATDDTARNSPPGGGTMGRDEAFEILGLRPGASREEIIAAHRRLMQKLHPDRGGSDYLAARINQAKDVLLG